MKRKIINIIVDIILIGMIFAITDFLMLKVIKSDKLWLDLLIYIVFYGVVFGTKKGIIYLWQRKKNINTNDDN